MKKYINCKLDGCQYSYYDYKNERYCCQKYPNMFINGDTNCDRY